MTLYNILEHSIDYYNNINLGKTMNINYLLEFFKIETFRIKNIFKIFRKSI